MSGLVSGAVAALVATLLHLAFLQPLLLRAEAYEPAAAAHASHSAGDPGGEGSAADLAPASGQTAQGQGSLGARPGLTIDPERDVQTMGAYLLIYAGFGLLLAAAVDAARRRGYAPEAWHATLWGAAGFAAFSLLPAFGVPPEPPGLASGDLLTRQVWWLACATTGLLTLAGTILGRRAKWVWLGLGCAALAGLMTIAPQPDTPGGPVPPELASLFATRALGIAAASWLVLTLCVLRRPHPRALHVR